MGRRPMEIGTDPAPKRFRLPDVKDVTLSVLKKVDPGIDGKVVQFGTDRGFTFIRNVG